MTRRRSFDSMVWPVAAAAVAFGFLVVGVMVWSVWGRMYCPGHLGLGPEHTPPPGSLVTSHSRWACLDVGPQHRLHPYRAEALWAASGLSAFVALIWAAHIFIGRSVRGARPGGLGRA